MVVGHGLDAVLPVDVGGDILHWPGPVEGDDGDDVLETVGLEPAQHVAHPAAFQLEHARGVGARDHRVGRRVVERQALQVDLDPPGLQEVDRRLQDRKGLEPEKIEFDQAGLLDILHVELADGHVRARIAVERNQFFERTVADHDAGGVGRGVAVQAFELQGDIDQPGDVLVLAPLFLELRLDLDRFLERHRVAGLFGTSLLSRSTWP